MIPEFLTEILLPRLFATSVQVTLLVAAVWLLCRVVPRISARTRTVLWWLVALQLVVGVLWSSPLRLPLLPAAAMDTAVAAPLHVTASAVADTQVPPQAQAVTAGSLAAPAATHWSWQGAVAMLWLLGLSAMLVRSLRGYLLARDVLRRSRPCTDAALLGALTIAAEAHGLRSPPRLRLSSAIESPQLVGPWRPILLLPAGHLQSLHGDELDMALTHELVHLQRRDLWWGLLPAAAQHLFFFHPLVHVAVREYELAREAACDAAVVAGQRHCARDYGRLLVRLGVAPRPSAGVASASPNFQFLKRRLVMLQNTASTPRPIALVLTLAVAALGVVPYRIVAAPLPQSDAPAPTPPAGAAAPRSATGPAAPRNTRVAAPVAAPPALPAAPAARSLIAPAPPAPSKPPSPPAPPPKSSGSSYMYSSGGVLPYVLMRGGTSVMSGSGDDFADARRLQKQHGDLLWFRKGSRGYLVTDPAMLVRVDGIFGEAMRLGQAQGKLGKRQAQLGTEQAKLGSQQAAMGAEMAQGSGEEAQRVVSSAGNHTSNTDDTSRRQESEAPAARQRRLSQEMGHLGERQAKLGTEQAKLGTEQAELGKQQAAASKRAERQLEKLIDAAIARGVAKPVSG